MSSIEGPVVAIVQARMTSSRLPGKILKPLAGAPLICRVVERVARIGGLDRVVVALADGVVHDPVAAVLEQSQAVIVRGPEEDVLSRTAFAAREAGAGTVIRVTSDCPLLDPAVSGATLAAYAAARPAGVRYARLAFDHGFPLGFDTEIFAASLLYETEAAANDSYEREHVTAFIWRRPEIYPSLILDAQPDRRHWRLVVDTEEDYRLVSLIYDALYEKNPSFGYTEICALFERCPDLLRINAHVEQRPYVGLC
jgi:spore coat polysaccharide biosynthesis protein SpsF